jgi:16S rRNA A1518/A1519 N6-dimethyltransferase RsmA/KsgA/DIM1 with predicted DNA glycosylase/AP lyase activity
MLENAKLKDEVALQGVGIGNLTSRLIKQQVAYEKIKKILTKLELKVSHYCSFFLISQSLSC